MKIRLLIIIGMIIAISITLISLEYNQETKSVMEMIARDEKSELVYVPDSICFVVDSVTGESGSTVTLDACITLNQFEEMGCTKPMLEYILRYFKLA